MSHDHTIRPTWKLYLVFVFGRQVISNSSVVLLVVYFLKMLANLVLHKLIMLINILCLNESGTERWGLDMSFFQQGASWTVSDRGVVWAVAFIWMLSLRKPSLSATVWWLSVSLSIIQNGGWKSLNKMVRCSCRSFVHFVNLADMNHITEAGVC